MNRKKERTIGAIVGGALTTATLVFALAIVPTVMAQSPATGEIETVATQETRPLTPEISADDIVITHENAAKPELLEELGTTIDDGDSASVDLTNLNVISETQAVEIARQIRFDGVAKRFDGDMPADIIAELAAEEHTATLIVSADPANVSLWSVTVGRGGSIFINAYSGESLDFMDVFCEAAYPEVYHEYSLR
jgi:hypothetical protein